MADPGWRGKRNFIVHIDYDGRSRIKYQLIMRDDAPSPPNARMPKRRSIAAETWRNWRMVSVYGFDATMRVVGEPRELRCNGRQFTSLFQVLRFTTGAIPSYGHE